MLNRLLSALVITFLCTTSNICAADTIFLKSGETIEGEIIFESPVFVRIKTVDMSTKEYLRTLIDHLEFEKPQDISEEKILPNPENPDGEDRLDAVILKSGRTVTGKIIKQTPIFIRIQTSDVVDVQNFMMETVDRIEPQSIDATEASLPTLAVEVEAPQTLDETEDTAEESGANISDKTSKNIEADSTPKKIAPLQKVISRNAPTPLKSSGSYRGSEYSDYPVGGGPGGASSDADIMAQRRQAALEMQRRQLERLAQRPQVAVAQQEAMMNVFTEGPGIFSPEKINEFLDQALSTGKGGKEATAKKSILQKVMSAGKSGAQEERSKSDKLKELVGRTFIAILIGIFLPIIVAIIFLIIHIVRTVKAKDVNKDVFDELESLETFKNEDKISKVEYDHLTQEAKSRLKQAPIKKFWNAFPRIFIYPLRGHVLLATISASVFFYVLRLAMLAPFYGFFAMIFAFTYLVACIVKIIETAVTQEREDVFDWPSYTDFVDWFGKAFLFLIGWFLCHGTAVFILFNLIKFEAIRMAVISLSISLFLVGMFIYPMLILSMSLVGGVASLNVLNVFKSINTVYMSYILMLTLLFIIQTLSALMNFIPAVKIPFFGDILKWFIFVYFMLIGMRLLGIFYKTHRTVLRWYDEDE